MDLVLLALVVLFFGWCMLVVFHQQEQEQGTLNIYVNTRRTLARNGGAKDTSGLVGHPAVQQQGSSTSAGTGPTHFEGVCVKNDSLSRKGGEGTPVALLAAESSK